jgi:hypothetical protein
MIMKPYKRDMKTLKKKNAKREAELEKRRQEWRELYAKTKKAK